MEEKDCKKGLPWHIVEKAIAREFAWLKSVLDLGIRPDHQDEVSLALGIENYQMLRQLSIAIVSGKISAREIKTLKPLGLWVDPGMQVKGPFSPERHGGEWHKRMMWIIKSHFLHRGFEVANEPYLNFGRADFGVYKSTYLNLYVEVGTTSLFKLWRNLSSMPSSIFLFVPTEYGAIELITNPEEIEITKTRPRLL